MRYKNALMLFGMLEVLKYTHIYDGIISDFFLLFLFESCLLFVCTLFCSEVVKKCTEEARDFCSSVLCCFELYIGS